MRAARGGESLRSAVYYGARDIRVEFSALAAEKVRKLDPAVRDHVAKKLRDTAEDPRRFVTRLSSVEAYRLRVGDYRVIMDVDWEREIIHVLTLGHRSTVNR